MRKHANNKRGLSNIIATILMILVVMIGMGLLFAFLTTYVASYQAGSGSSVLESMTVEDVWFKNSNQVEIWVYNVGKVGFTIMNIYVNGTPPPAPPSIVQLDEQGNLIPVNSPLTIGSPVVPVDCHADILITLAQQYNGNEYTFKIVTSRGSAFSESALAPQS
jgi:flagellin-like protein